MHPEARIGFEIAIGAPCVFLIFLRAWVLSRYKRARFGNTVTNFALYLTCLCVIGTNALNIWTSAKLIEYKNHKHLIREPSTGLPLHLVPTALKMAFALKCFYVVGLYAVKAAFLGIYVELEQHLEKKLRIFVKISIWVTIVAFIANFLLTILWCQPFETNWTLVPGKLCSSLRSMVVVGFGTASNIFTDLAIMAIPLFVLKTLPLRRREMYAIAFVLFLGLICVVGAIVRFVFLWDFIYDNNKDSLPSQQNVIVYTSELEVVIAVWAGCLPALRALMRRPSRNGTSVSGSGMQLSGNGFSGGRSGGRGSKHLDITAPDIALTRDDHYNIHSHGRQHQSPVLNGGNPMLAAGFGYGGYVAERDDYGDRKLSSDSERDGSEVELGRGIALSPLSPRSMRSYSKGR